MLVSILHAVRYSLWWVHVTPFPLQAVAHHMQYAISYMNVINCGIHFSGFYFFFDFPRSGSYCLFKTLSRILLLFAWQIPSKLRVDRPLLKPKRKVPRGLIQLVSVPAPTPPHSEITATMQATAPAPAPSSAAGIPMTTKAPPLTARVNGANSRESVQPSTLSTNVATSAGESVVPSRVHSTSHRTAHSPLKMRDSSLTAIDLSSHNGEIDASASNGSRVKELAAAMNRPGNQNEFQKEAGEQKENFRTGSRRL